MRLKISFSHAGSLLLPRHYQSALQGMVYAMIGDKKIQKFLHDEGFPWEKRRFKPLVYSWLQGTYRLQEGSIRFESPVELYLSSCWEPLVQALSYSLVDGSLNLAGQSLTVNSLHMIPEPEFTDEDMIVRTLSPITMYSTLHTAEGRKVTHYYDVRDQQFSELIRKNLVKKARAMYNLDLQDRPFQLEPVGRVDPRQQKSIRYRNFLIKAWHGTFRMRGDKELKRVAYQVGLGGKNTQGFGMVEYRK